MLSDHKGWVVSLAFEPGGTKTTLLASVGGDGTVRIWTLDNDLLIRKACAIAGRNLSPAEWTKYFGDDDLHLTCPDRPIHTDYLEQGMKLAENGKIEDAIAAFATELKRFRSQSFDPSRLARRYAAKKEIEEATKSFIGLYWNPDSEVVYQFLGSEYASMMAHAESKWARAMELDPSWRIVPADLWAHFVSAGLVHAGDEVAGKGDATVALAAYRRAMELSPARRFDPGLRAAPHLLKKGDSLAAFGDVDAAVSTYEKAIELDPSRSLEPVSRAHRLAADRVRRQTKSLSKAGKIDQALADYRRASAWNADLPEDPGIENALCWNGSL
jgi:tetratricopeptide (TPR) repeat protein